MFPPPVFGDERDRSAGGLRRRVEPEQLQRLQRVHRRPSRVGPVHRRGRRPGSRRRRPTARRGPRARASARPSLRAPLGLARAAISSGADVHKIAQHLPPDGGVTVEQPLDDVHRSQAIDGRFAECMSNDGADVRDSAIAAHAVPASRPDRAGNRPICGSFTTTRRWSRRTTAGGRPDRRPTIPPGGSPTRGGFLGVHNGSPGRPRQRGTRGRGGLTDPVDDDWGQLYAFLPDESWCARHTRASAHCGPRAGLVLDEHVVMRLGPVVADEHSTRASWSSSGSSRGDQQLADGSVLQARHPATVTRPHRPAGRTI